ncbi:DNA-directed RNA polymerase II subunit RPB1 [Hordeum vulgare]|nr:DNA-directed RNA polymerase II subunit RPB1 [Hordeum vulgare]
MAAANAKSARVAYHAMEVALARVKEIQANIENAHVKIPKASSKSSMHHTSEEAAVVYAEMNVNPAAAEAMKLFPHETFEQEVEMRALSESDESLEELRVAQEEVEKRLSIEEPAVEYQHELWRCHYYEYYNDEGDTDGDDIIVVEFCVGDAESSTSGISHEQVIEISSNIGEV